MAVPYTFGTATAAIPLSQLDSNFATAITLGNTAVYLGNTTTSIGNLTLTNVTISSGEVTTGNVSVSGNVTLSGGTANGVAYLNGSKVLTTGSALVFDGSNLGLGVTPSAWKSTWAAFQLGNRSLARSNAGAGDLTMVFNGYFDSTDSRWEFQNSGDYAARYSITGSGIHSWHTSTAAGANANDPITFTQAMTLDASGNWILGGTTARTRLTLQAGEANAPTLGTASGGAFFGNSSVAYGTLFGTSGAGYGWIQQQRVDGSGTAYDLCIQPSGGNLLVGTTTDSGKVYSKNANNTDTLVAHSTSTTYQQTLLLLLAARNTTNTSFYAIAYYNLGASAYKFIVADSGNVTNANNSYGGISDIKLKENITDATPKLADLMKVKVRQYNFKSEPSNKQLGVVAQELEQVFPSMVDESPDKDAEGNDLGTTTKSVKYSVFVPMLIKAIQEQQAIIQSLTARITALESA